MVSYGDSAALVFLFLMLNSRKLQMLLRLVISGVTWWLIGLRIRFVIAVVSLLPSPELLHASGKAKKEKKKKSIGDFRYFSILTYFLLYVWII